jgi:mono/diheme cytochrome c family protein
MRKLISSVVFTTSILMSCSSNEKKPEKKDDIASIRTLEGEELAKRGNYLLTIGSCHDCHSPKNMTPIGPVIDSTKLLSGHPAGAPLPPFDAKALNPDGWINMSPDLTAFVGPWGVSYSANLTPDSATGIGAWSEETFIQSLRTGKHLGQPNGRPIMPPMPWNFVGQMTDEDLRAVYAYLRTLPPVSNRVPVPVPPDQAMKMQ